jgi:ceramide glucosyltransferase
VDLPHPAAWWRHQVYWDQNTKAARPFGFAATVLTRSVPFALVFALARLLDPLGLWVLAGAVALRLASAAIVLRVALRDREGLASLAWLPLRDIAALASWMLALTKRSFVWRGERFGLTAGGRIVPRRV